MRRFAPIRSAARSRGATPPARDCSRSLMRSPVRSAPLPRAWHKPFACGCTRGVASPPSPSAVCSPSAVRRSPFGHAPPDHGSSSARPAARKAACRHVSALDLKKEAVDGNICFRSTYANGRRVCDCLYPLPFWLQVLLSSLLGT